MSHTKSSLNDILEGVGVQNAFNDLMSLWTLPEIEERRRNRRIPPKFHFWYSTGDSLARWARSSQVKWRSNSTFKSKTQSGHKKGIQWTCLWRWDWGNTGFSLRDHDHSNAGHVTFMQFKNQWIMHMDFRLNKEKAKERNDSALRFF